MRIIDADALMNHRRKAVMFYWSGEAQEDVVTISEIKNAPTLTPESLMKCGKWKPDWFGEGLYACSDCGKVFDLSVNGEDFRFCPYCGCKMVED